MHIFSNTCTHYQQQQLKAMRKGKAGAWEGLQGGTKKGGNYAIIILKIKNIHIKRRQIIGT